MPDPTRHARHARQLPPTPPFTDTTIDAYLDSRHAVLWGRSFDIVADRSAARAWLRNVLVELAAIEGNDR